ncbi:MAG TPA: hypothetical protein EYP08_08190 [Pyrodictiaceae archaeon]|nr:hypothetical protein [Pyrodictiaceae archaeon]HIQ55489.1 hypothetical protein [Pyrodictium sp.]
MRADEKCEMVLEKFFEYVKDAVYEIFKESNSICTLQTLYQIVIKYINDNFDSLEYCRNFIEAQWNISLERFDKVKYVQYLLHVCNVLESKIFDVCMEVLSKFVGTRHKYVYTKLSIMISSYVSLTLTHISRLCRRLASIDNLKTLSVLELLLFLISLRSMIICKMISSYTVKELLARIESIESSLQQVVTEEVVVSESIEEFLRETI